MGIDVEGILSDFLFLKMEGVVVGIVGLCDEKVLNFEPDFKIF